jgi:uncharacterized protein (DUF1015 family)
VIDGEQRAELAARHPDNIVQIDLPSESRGGGDRYQEAARLLDDWQRRGVLTRDPQPSFYGYRMTYTDDRGTPRRTTGVIGALELSAPGEGGILPHEFTTPKAKSDRRQILDACETDLSVVWALTPARGLAAEAEAAETDTETSSWTDDDGVGHELWVITAPETIDAIRDLVAGAPVVIADGHHRYETALAHRDDRRAARGDAGEADSLMTFVVELAEDELTVRPIHRLLRGTGADLAAQLDPWFEVTEWEGGEPDTPTLQQRGVLALVTRDGLWSLTPRAEHDQPGELDTTRLQRALDALDIDDVTYQHGDENVRRAVDKGDADAGVLVRPATVKQILAIADGGERMPPKTTFFHPKPRTGTVLRPL